MAATGLRADAPRAEGRRRLPQLLHLEPRGPLRRCTVDEWSRRIKLLLGWHFIQIVDVQGTVGHSRSQSGAGARIFRKRGWSFVVGSPSLKRARLRSAFLQHRFQHEAHSWHTAY
jgi:hypothetical protein